jgi:hypothetical protein
MSSFFFSGRIELGSSSAPGSQAAARELVDPKNGQGHQLLGIAYAWKGDMDEALKEFQAAAETDGDCACEGASGAVCVSGLEARIDEFASAVLSGEKIDHRFDRQMPAV